MISLSLFSLQDMYVTALWLEAWMWIAATRPQGSASVSQVIRVFAVKPARRVCTWIVLPGSVCHVTVVHVEPSAYSATGKQQKLKVKLILFYYTHKKASALKDQTGLNKGAIDLQNISHIFYHFVNYIWCQDLKASNLLI